MKTMFTDFFSKLFAKGPAPNGPCGASGRYGCKPMLVGHVAFQAVNDLLWREVA